MLEFILSTDSAEEAFIFHEADLAEQESAEKVPIVLQGGKFADFDGTNKQESWKAIES